MVKFVGLLISENCVCPVFRSVVARLVGLLDYKEREIREKNDTKRLRDVLIRTDRYVVGLITLSKP